MKAEHFAGVDSVVLSAPPGWDDEEHGPCGELPVQRLNGICTSCWGFSLRERLSVLFGRKVYVHVASGRTQPPISLMVERWNEQEVIP